jgi:hypothetical protein
MDSIINLRRARKRKAREIASKEAAANRIRSGRSRAEREVADTVNSDMRQGVCGEIVKHSLSRATAPAFRLSPRFGTN